MTKKLDPNAPLTAAEIVARAPMVASETRASEMREYRGLSRLMAKKGTLSPGESDQIALAAKGFGMPLTYLQGDVEVIRRVDQLEKATENYTTQCSRLESEIEAASKAIAAAEETVKQHKIERARLQSQRTAINGNWQQLTFLRTANPRLYSDDFTKALANHPPVRDKGEFDSLGLRHVL